MKDRLTLIVRDEKGEKRLTLHRRAKHVFGLTVAAAVILMAAATVSLMYLGSEVRTLETSKTELLAQKDALERQHRRLQDAIADAKVQMDAIELAMGLKKAQNVSLDDRVRRARLSSEERARVLELVPNGSPVPYNGISSKFGYRIHPITQKRELHMGSDLRSAMNTPVRATADGVVEFAGDHGNYGRLVILDHAYGFRTFYGHLNKAAVKNGAVVKKGDLIGYSGDSGRTNGPHLHYEVRFIQRVLNPYWFVRWDMAHYDEIFAKVKKVSWEPILEAIASDRNAPAVLLTAAER